MDDAIRAAARPWVLPRDHWSHYLDDAAVRALLAQLAKKVRG